MKHAPITIIHVADLARPWADIAQCRRHDALTEVLNTGRFHHDCLRQLTLSDVADYLDKPLRQFDGSPVDLRTFIEGDE